MIQFFVDKNTWDNIHFIKRFLINLELVSGLKVNKEKCSIIGININEDVLDNFANTLRCRIGEISLAYLGVKVGSTHRQSSKWDYVVKKVKNRLKKWEGLNLSVGERLTLINVVLVSLPVYYLSTYRAPLKALREITKL